VSAADPPVFRLQSPSGGVARHSGSDCHHTEGAANRIDNVGPG